VDVWVPAVLPVHDLDRPHVAVHPELALCRPGRRVLPPYELRHHIDAMIEKNPLVAVNEVWEHLVDDHDTTVSYGAVRGYIANRRPELLHPTHAIR
jgi:hypothetical protein